MHGNDLCKFRNRLRWLLILDDICASTEVASGDAMQILVLKIDVISVISVLTCGDAKWYLT